MLDIKFKHFTWDEILKPMKKHKLEWNNIPLQLRGNIVTTMKVLDELREYYGEPIIINSSYRSPKVNEMEGGRSDSLHLVFNAIDFTVKNKQDLMGLYLTLNNWDNMRNKFSYLPKTVGNFGLGYYPTFIHLDTRSILKRKAPARWRG